MAVKTAKGLLALALVIMVAAGGARTGRAQCLATGESYQVGTRGAVVMEAESGRLLFAQEAHKRLPMASTTKIMTALLTLEQPELDQEFIVDPEAIRVEGSSMGLAEGDTVTLRALAGGMLTASGNDAAGAAAVRIAGDTAAFAQLMNRRAGELGMANTHFVTPSGLDAEEHYSTAYDMALLGRAALQNPEFARMAASKRLSLTFGNPPYQRSLLNHNRLLSLFPEAIGIKTGFTKTAGRCLVSAARRDGVTLIVVTLGCGDDWNTHMALYQRYFPLLERRQLAPAGELLLPVTGGTAASVPLVQTEPPAMVALKGEASTITEAIFAPSFGYAPIAKGDVVGRIVYYQDGRPVAESPLAAAATVPALPPPEKKGFGGWLQGIGKKIRDMG